MPSHEPIAATLIPKAAEPPIPVRVVSTRSVNNNTSISAEPTQPTTSETKVAESTKPAESVTLSPDASAKARQEQAYRLREQAIKQRELDLEAKIKDAAEYSQLKSKLAAKDYSAIDTLGLSYDQLTEYEMAKQQGEPSPEVKAVNDLKAEVDALKKSQEDSATKEYDATVAEYRKEIANVASTNPEFAAIKDLQHEDGVLQYFLDSFEEGEEISIDQAMSDVKAFLKEEAQRLAILLDKPAEPERKLPRPGLRTLTQQVSVGATPPNTKPLSAMSDQERYAEARRRALAKRQG